MLYRCVDELESASLHDACFISSEFLGEDMIWYLRDAVIEGRSFLGRRGNSLNPGADRYATPELKITFEGAEIREVTRYGYLVQAPPEQGGGTLEEWPDFYYPQKALVPMAKKLFSNHNYIVGINREAFDVWSCDVSRLEDAEIYNVTFTARTILMEWEAYGKEAWYLSHKNRIIPRYLADLMEAGRVKQVCFGLEYPKGYPDCKIYFCSGEEKPYRLSLSPQGTANAFATAWEMWEAPLFEKTNLQRCWADVSIHSIDGKRLEQWRAEMEEKR